MKQSEALVNLGVEGRDNFGCGLTSAFKIPNYQYDCTNRNHPACGGNDGKNVYASSCLADVSEKFTTTTFTSLKDIIDNRGLKDKHVTMKIDI